MKIWGYVAIVTALIASYAGVWKLADNHGYDRAILEQAEVARELDKLWREAVKEKESKNEKLQVDLIKARNNVQVRTRTIEKQVKVYVKDHAICNYSPAVVELYNEAWGHYREGMPESPSILETEAPKARTVTQSQLFGKTLEYADWCTQLELQFDALTKALDNLGY